MQSTKLNHSCFTQVISFFKVPYKILITETGASFLAWRLRDVIPQLHRGLRKLTLPGDLAVCQHCRGKKDPTFMLVADAAQVSEQVKTELVLQAYDSKASELQSTHGCTTIRVKKRKGL